MILVRGIVPPGNDKESRSMFFFGGGFGVVRMSGTVGGTVGGTDEWYG